MKRKSGDEHGDERYGAYLAHLRALISHRTVTSDEAALQPAIEYCGRIFSAALTPLGWAVGCDAAGNMRCVPPRVDTSRKVLWLNAHIDTVNARPEDFGGRDPFACHETATHLIGRGACDCKAGVAFMLWYAEGIARGALPAPNGGFLVTRREEAGSKLPRTAPQFAADMGTGDLPVSSLKRGTFVQVLENTVSLAHEPLVPPEVAVYDCERHSFSLMCDGPLHLLGAALLALV
eukprot:4336549-Prymnesium_polylepis.1